MKVAVYAYRLHVINQLNEFLNQYMEKQEGIDISFFTEEREFAESMGNLEFDLLIMHIEWRTGGELEETGHLTKKSEDVPVIFVSSKWTNMENFFRLNAPAYFFKLACYRQFQLVMDLMWKSYRDTNQVFIGEYSGKVFILKLDEIYYFESYMRKTFVCTDISRLRINLSLDMAIERLPGEQFVRSHQGYLANLKHVRSMERDRLILLNGSIIPVSVSRRKRTKEKLITYFIHF